jgi:hypothetical protein
MHEYKEQSNFQGSTLKKKLRIMPTSWKIQKIIPGSIKGYQYIPGQYCSSISSAQKLLHQTETKNSSKDFRLP